ncbi:hypothetical protein [Luteipulveratus flavus]|uniref:Lipoprotein n=1 Tax=Luteipulveratus flavus TaxID=3031728 RepID=A0ABT6C2B9_9MICO|nr:hypothetical protein [Luteipulveratus sp. YIM 133296]MDF8262957.1 hypothetical protein [Luteipulveratus sp. YIM 133296]
MRGRVAGLLLAAMVVATTLSACGAAALPAARSSSATRAYAIGEWVGSYGSLADLSRQSTMIVRGTVSSAPPQVVPAAMPGSEDLVDLATVVTFRVTQTLGGDLRSGTELKIHQSGSPDAPLFDPEESAWLVGGREYVLYLKPFFFVPGRSTGRYVVTGGLGAFAPSGDALTRTTARDTVPRTTDLQAVTASAGVLGTRPAAP